MNLEKIVSGVSAFIILILIIGVLMLMINRSIKAELSNDEQNYVKKLGNVAYQNGVLVEYVEFGTGKLTCVSGILTNNQSAYGNISVFCK